MTLKVLGHFNAAGSLVAVDCYFKERSKMLNLVVETKEEKHFAVDWMEKHMIGLFEP